MTLTKDLSRLALPIGDPNGIGPEIVLRACAEVKNADIIVVGERKILEFYAGRFGLPLPASIHDPGTETEVQPGVVTPEAGRATIVATEVAIRMAQKGEVEAVVAAPHNETAVYKAGIDFDGYPSLLARITETNPDEVFLLLVSPNHRIVNVTLHVPLRMALEQLTVERILKAAHAADMACRRFGIAAPRIGLCGINPHAGEKGLFGSEDEEILVPAVQQGKERGLDLVGPVGADVLLAEGGYDVYLAMYHDQAHIPIKLAGRGNSFGMSIGAPVLLATVAHGSAHDIAGQGKADPAALTGVLTKLANLLKSDSQ